MRVVLTGASGFIGRQALSALNAAGAQVHAVGRAPVTGAAAWHGADLLDPQADLAALMRGIRPQAVLHLAWCVEPGRFWTDPANAAWRAASLALARAAAEAGAVQFTGVGTCYEYDWPSEGDCREDRTLLAVHTPYDAAKAACHADLAALFAGGGPSLAWARLFFLYGPAEDPRRLVAGVARALARGEAANCSRGLAVRDFIDVRDTGAALAAITLARLAGPVNVGSGAGVSVAALAQTLGRLAGRPDLVRLGALPDREGEPPRIVADVTRLTTGTDYRPRHGLEQGLGEVLAEWRGRAEA